jgi:hypothetical protein
MRDAAMSSALSRMQREALHAREAKKCPPHPKERQFWQPGDYATPDRLVCGRCGTTLAQRRHTHIIEP